MQSNAGMAKQTEERRLALHAKLRSHLVLWLISWLVGSTILELTWSPLVDQVREKTAWRLLNRKSGFSIRIGVLLYKQLIRPTIDYAWPM